MSFLSSWKALTSFTIRGRYLFLAVALEEYFPVLIGRSIRFRCFGPRHQIGEKGTARQGQRKQGKEDDQS